MINNLTESDKLGIEYIEIGGINTTMLSVADLVYTLLTKNNVTLVDDFKKLIIHIVKLI